MSDDHRVVKRTIPRRVAPAAVVLWIAALAACGGSQGPPPPSPGAIPAGQAIGSAGITGRVLFQGTPPRRRPITMLGEAACSAGGKEVLGEEVIVNPDGTLRDVYVHIVSGLGDRAFAPPAAPAVMDQAGCMFVPHLLAVQANQIIVFKSSDPVVHNVRAIAEHNPVFNVSMTGRGRTVKRFFSNPEVVTIRCDIHAWMSAYIAVGANPFQSVTGNGGTFDLRALPAGTFEVEAWHGTLGSSRQTVTLADGEQRDIEFTFAAGSP
jgi:plastocyanin